MSGCSWHFLVQRVPIVSGKAISSLPKTPASLIAVLGRQNLGAIQLGYGWLLYGYFLNHVLQKSPNASKRTKEQK